MLRIGRGQRSGTLGLRRIDPDGVDLLLGLLGDIAKKTKREINTVWIYPPKAERALALASADPERVTEV